MNPKQRSNLRKHRVQIVQDVEPRGDILDCLFDDEVLTENDVEEISSGTTRRERCQTLLRLLPRRGPNAYGAFTRALTRTSLDHLAEKLKVVSEESNIRNNNVTRAETQEQIEADFRLESNTESLKSVFKRCNPFKVNTAVRSVLEQHGPALLENVEPRDLFDTLIQESVLTEDDVEEIESGGPRKTKVEVMMLILLHKTEDNVVHSLITALSGKYSFILESPTAYPEEELNHEDEINANTTKMATELEVRSATVKDSSVRDFHQSTVPLGQSQKQCFQTFSENSVSNTVDSCTVRQDSNQLNLGRLAPGQQMVAIPTQRRDKRLGIAFDHLSTLVNQGDFVKFDTTTLTLKQKFPLYHDLMCMIGYLNACKDLFQADFDGASRNIKSSLDIVPRTSNPRYFTLELLTAKSRMYITQKKLGKLRTTQDEAMMVMETDPAGCAGRAAGWVCINDARTITAQLSCLNLSKQNVKQVYNKLYLRAKTSLQRSMTNFKTDGGKDGPFGFGFALTRLVILLMRCGDNGNTMELLEPSTADITTAGEYIQHLEDSDIELSNILQMHFSLAKCDYQFRRGNPKRAIEHAQTAFELASELNILEFKEHAHNRLKVLQSKLTVQPVRDLESEFYDSFMVTNTEGVCESDTT